MYHRVSMSILFISFIITHLLLGGESSCPTPKSHPLAPALYVFGDSMVDNGNNNRLPTIGRGNYAPYSDDFPCPVMLGRFTNARTPADFIAEYLGLPYPPPYASQLQSGVALQNPTPDSYLSNSKSSKGYNYASAMCGILQNTGLNGGKCYSFDEQIEMFNKTKVSQLSPRLKDPTELSKHLSNSIFFVSVGNNDYLNNYLNNLFLPNKQYDPSSFAKLLLDTFSQQLQRLYDLGARKVVLTDVGSIGCIPTMVKATGRKNKGKCDEDANKIVCIYNKQLPLMLNKLTSTLEGVHFTIARTYPLSYDAVTNPSKYGFGDSSNPCCTTFVNGTLQCVPELKPCQDPENHYFWDGFHPTENAYSYFIRQCIHGSSVCVPMNLEKLVQI